MWKYYALLSALFAGLTAIFAKAGVRGVDGSLATAIRTVVVLLLAWAIVFAGGKAQGIRALDRQNWIFLVLSGLATGLSWVFYLKALETGDVSKVAPIDKLSVALVIIMGILVLGEPADTRTIAGGLLIIAGTIIILL
jgi:bacterial/archaeal transporter family protein